MLIAFPTDMIVLGKSARPSSLNTPSIPLRHPMFLTPCQLRLPQHTKMSRLPWPINTDTPPTSLTEYAPATAPPPHPPHLVQVPRIQATHLSV